MPWRLISIIIIFGVLLTFIGLNLTYSCDLSLGFKVFTGVPVYLTVFVSFMLGMISSLPFFIFGSVKKMLKKEKKQKDPKVSAKDKSKGLPADKTTTAKSTENTGPYGIN